MGCLVGFVVAVELIHAVRAELVFSPDASWTLARLLIGLSVAGLAVAAGVAAAGAFTIWSRRPSSTEPLEPLALGRATLAVLAIAAVAFGILVRLAWLEEIPPAVWSDEIVPLRPSLALTGTVRDLADPIRMMPTDGSTMAMAGVIYLEGYRFLLKTAGETLFAVRLPSALAGIVAVLTGMLLARELLPRGGATLAGIALAGLRWQLILARYAWNALALVPIVDVATVLLLRARRRSSLGLAAAGGLVAGIGAYIYLGAWIVAVALGLLLLWPSVAIITLRRRAALAAAFGLAFLLAVAPIVLFAGDRPAPYFGRGSDQSLLLDMRRHKDGMVPFTVLADSLQAPWLVPDPVRRQDLPVSRLGWILGIPVAIALLRALRSPKEDLSGVLLAHAVVATAASVRWGLPGHPNGYRFLYLTSSAALAAAAGALWLIRRAHPSTRRSASLAAVGLFGISALLGARDALLRWGPSREVFYWNWGNSTLIGRAAARWDRLGSVAIDSSLGDSRFVTDAVREFALDPARDRMDALGLGSRASAGLPRCARVVLPDAPVHPGERRVEMVQDGWGVVYAQVLAKPCSAP